jgi:arylsulfatase A-like enzyme
VRAIDVAPTVARLLGIEPPASCEGDAIAAIAPPVAASR